jgi:hypothetical protein
VSSPHQNQINRLSKELADLRKAITFGEDTFERSGAGRIPEPAAQPAGCCAPRAGNDAARCCT